MRFASRTAVIALMFATVAAWCQQKINPKTQINWPANCQDYKVADAACPPLGSSSYKGNWSATTTYLINDTVFYNGSTYISVQNNNLNQNPATATTYWGIFATGNASAGPAGTVQTAGAVAGTFDQATSANLATLIKTATGCTTPLQPWVPQSNTCVPFPQLTTFNTWTGVNVFDILGVNKTLGLGAGLQYAFGSGCATASGVLGSCTATMHLQVTEPDTNYLVSGCTIKGMTGGAIMGELASFTTTSFTVTEYSPTGSTTGGTIACLVTHF
jgi:hypothetical protein